MSLKPSAVQAALMEEAITAKIETGSLEEAARAELEDAKDDLRRYRQER